MNAFSHCNRGHLKTPENTYKDRRWLRCKTCISQQKALKYRSDAIFRERRKAYAHWFRCGDPEGKSWPEIKAELSCQPSH